MRPGVVLSGPAAFLLTVFVPSPAGFSGPAWLTLGLAAWMAIWWATEAVPLAAGMRLAGDVLLERRRLVAWLFEPLLAWRERGAVGA